ncbi:hypothetical protein HYX18_01060 [Candidatus Woesearchaeota archaeon]|nr:hypothetical protein [Candidatus Woesearchaeota archaeon]
MVLEISGETASILRSLLNKERIGGRHTEEKNCLRWIKNLHPKKRREVLKEWEKCVKEGLVLRLIKTGENHVSLNPRRLKEIYQLIK